MLNASTTAGSAAVIGSFRQHYEQVLQAVTAFRSAGWVVTSPAGTPVVEEGIPFVRFTSDDVGLDDPAVQTLALHRILRADIVYVVAPEGYVGRTTCYEVGRAVQAGRPLYFSEPPADLPLRVPGDHVVAVGALARLLVALEPSALHEGLDDEAGERERRLLRADFVLD